MNRFRHVYASLIGFSRVKSWSFVSEPFSDFHVKFARSNRGAKIEI